MATIIPSILTQSETDLTSRVNLIKNTVEMIHIDIMDGRYVHSNSLSIATTARVLKDIDFTNKIELHLMVQDPEYVIDEVMQIKNLHQVVIHTDSTHDGKDTLRIYKDKGLRVGICYLLNADIRIPKHESADFFLVLAEEKPGYSGMPFSNLALTQIKSLKEKYAKVIEVDGGINEYTGRLCVDAGANGLIINSTIFKSTDPLAELISLQQLFSDDNKSV